MSYERDISIDWEARAKRAEAEAESLRVMLAEKQRLLDEDFWHKQYSQTHQALQDIEADLRAQVATLKAERDEFEHAAAEWSTIANHGEAQLSAATTRVKELIWALHQIRDSHNIWNHINVFSAEGQELSRILDKARVS